MKRCPVCGVEFEAKWPRSRAVYCSRKCSNHADAKRAKARNLAQIDADNCAWGGCSASLYRGRYCKEHYERRRFEPYGLSLARYEQMLEEQAGRCAACLEPLREGRGGAAIDHDHDCCPGVGSCGKCVRGILCLHCNRLAGHMEGKRASAVLEYLKKWAIERAEQAESGP